jgi:hypothetical protein
MSIPAHVPLAAARCVILRRHRVVLLALLVTLACGIQDEKAKYLGEWRLMNRTQPSLKIYKEGDVYVVEDHVNGNFGAVLKLPATFHDGHFTVSFMGEQRLVYSAATDRILYAGSEYVRSEK